MTMWLKLSTAVTIKMGPFLDDVDGKTAETALTLSQADFRLAKNGGDIAQKNESTAGAHDELGYYDVLLDATDTNTLGRLRVMVHESGALPVWADFMIVAANVWDALFGADKLQVDAVEINSSAGDAVLQGLAARAVVTGAAITGTLSTTQMTTNLTEATTSHYVGRTLVWLTGVLAGQAVLITAYGGTSKIFTYTTTPTNEAPSNGDLFVVL